MSLTRELKEAWLFGQLELGQETEDESKVDADARVVGTALQKVLKTESVRTETEAS
jgi:hypothetical protein